MVSTRRQKQAAVDHLKDAGILQQVFKFLPGNWLFLGALCRDWKEVYADMPDQQVCSVRLDSGNKLVACASKSTLYSAVVASPATVRLACECGLQPDCEPLWTPLSVSAGLHADVPTLITLCELGMPLSSRLVQAAALSGRLNILQHLMKQQQCPRLDALACYAARSGSVSMLRWLGTEGGCEFTRSTCAAAAAAGQLAALQHLRSAGCDWEEEAISCYAARGGSIELIEWLRPQEGVVIGANVLAAAAGCGHTTLCEHLRSVGCAWNVSACTQAAMYGHLSTLRWLREHGCPWNVQAVCMNAAGNGCTDTLDYLMQQGEVLDAELLTRALNAAGTEDRIRTAQWLRQHGAEWPAVLGCDVGLYAQWIGDTLAWARVEGCTSPLPQW
jgi:hypothetical protein